MSSLSFDYYFSLSPVFLQCYIERKKPWNRIYIRLVHTNGKVDHRSDGQSERNAPYDGPFAAPPPLFVP